MRAALYARVSAAGQSPDMQLKEMHLVAAQRGWNVVGQYVDQASGALDSRPALGQMLTHAARGKIDVVVVWKLDRLGRSLQHLLKLLAELDACGVAFISLRDTGIDTATPTGRLLLQLLGAFAEFERSLIQERVRAGVRQAKARGVHCGRPVIALELRPARAMLAEGRSLREVSGILRVSRTTLLRRLDESGEAWCYMDRDGDWHTRGPKVAVDPALELLGPPGPQPMSADAP